MIQELLKKNHKIVLFDGVCNLCNSSVLRIIKHDKKNVFLFASLQSEFGKKTTSYFNINTAKIDSIILIESATKFSIKSTAALSILKHFGGFWMIFQIGWILPVFLRDILYNYIAKNRYSWFGKKDKCMIPTSQIKSKFI